MGEFLQSFDIRNKKGISAAAVIGAVLAVLGIAGHLHLLDPVFGAEAIARNLFLNLAPNYKTGLAYAVIGIALIAIGMMPDKYVQADLYTDAIVLHKKLPGTPADKGREKPDPYRRDAEHVVEETPAGEAKDAAAMSDADVFLFDDLDAIVGSQRGLGDPQSLLIVTEAGKKIQVMVPPRNGMPAEAEAVWRSYCVRYNRELDAEKSAEGNKKKL